MGLFDFLFGKGETAAKPYQGPQFATQEQVLSNAVLNAMYSQNPNLFGFQGGSSAGQPMQAGQYGGGRTGMSGGFGKSGGYGGFGGKTNFGQGGMMSGMKPPQQQAPAQMAPVKSYTPYQFKEPNVSFAQRNPYQYAEIQKINVPDLYAAQMGRASSAINEQADLSREQLLADMNRRGMLTSGAANRGVAFNMRERDRQLGDLSAQFAIEQGRQQLSEDQQRRQMMQQRDIAQAEELFRQSGASDDQARFLAAQSMGMQQAQAGQNLAGYGANLEGRKQMSAEQQLAYLQQRQPLEDLMRLYGMQIGQIGGTRGTTGLIPAMVTNAAGAVTGGYFG